MLDMGAVAVLSSLQQSAQFLLLNESLKYFQDFTSMILFLRDKVFLTNCLFFSTPRNYLYFLHNMSTHCKKEENDTITTFQLLVDMKLPFVAL